MRSEVQILPGPPLLRITALNEDSCASAHFAFICLVLHKRYFALFSVMIALISTKILPKKEKEGIVGLGFLRRIFYARQGARRSERRSIHQYVTERVASATPQSIKKTSKMGP